MKSRAKLFADDTSLFSTVKNVLHSCEILTNDLDIINHWAYQWKMSFNPDPNKQATEVIFSRKNKKTIQPPLIFNNTLVSVASQQKHLGLILDEKLVFKDHVSEKIAKANRGIGAIKRMSKYLPRKSLISMYTSFIRPHLDYADVVYDQPHNASFSSKIETVQYNAALAITGAIKGTSRERLYKELGLESLCDRRWYHRLVLFFNIVNGNSPDYLRSTLPGAHVSRNPTRTDLFMRFKGSTDYFNGSFFPFCVNEWNKLKIEVRSLKSVSLFKKSLLKTKRPEKSPVYKILDPLGLKLLTRLRLNFSHLREHKFNHNFQDTINPLCSCSLETESTSHFLLRCSLFSGCRKTLLDNIIDIVGSISNLNETDLIDLLLYGCKSYSPVVNTNILKCTISYLKDTERFDIALINEA